MSASVCVCPLVCVGICVYIYVCIYVYVYIWVCVHMFVYVGVHVCVQPLVLFTLSFEIGSVIGLELNQ